MFISFEGPDGAGKTTQIDSLVAHLTALGLEVVKTREPGGCPLADKVRALLLQRDGGDWQNMSEVLLLYAARVEHVETVIKPALKAGKTVISDRFADSTFSYQGYGHGLDLDAIRAIDKHSIGGFKPDLTFILDIDVREGLARTAARFEDQGDDGAQTEDRFERMDIAFHERLRQGYLDIAKKEPGRCRVINAAQSIEAIGRDIKTVMDDYLLSQSTKGGAHVAS